jgi:HEAT repeat protein
MNTDSNLSQRPKAESARKHLSLARRWIQIIAALVGLLSLGTLLAILLSPGGLKPSSNALSTETAELPQEAIPLSPAAHAEVAADHHPSAARPTQPARVISLPPATPAVRQLVGNLLNLQAGTWNEEQVVAWRQNFQQLVKQGSDAVPAIAEFLSKNSDIDFGAGGKLVLGYRSARAAMIDALSQIGGPVAELALTGVLQSSAEPRELAVIAQNLEKLNPGVHQQEALDAARQALEMVAQGGLQNRDAAPLFEILQQYGGPGIAPDLLSRMNQWEYYSAISLARLPDDAGVPTLIQLATDQSTAGPGSKAIALQMLAQLATQSPEAQAALLQQVRQGKLTAFNWIGLEPLLAGNQLVFEDSVFNNPLDRVSVNDIKQTHVPFGNQSFYTLPLGALTIEQIDQRSALINDLLSATSDPVANQMLQKAKAELSQRLSQIAATK